MIIANITLFIVWLITALAYWHERRERTQITAQIVSASASTAARVADLGLHAIVKDKIRPFVEEAKSLEATGQQKKMQVLLAFLKAHPGTPVESAERAIESILAET